MIELSSVSSAILIDNISSQNQEGTKRSSGAHVMLSEGSTHWPLGFCQSSTSEGQHTPSQLLPFLCSHSAHC